MTDSTDDLLERAMAWLHRANDGMYSGYSEETHDIMRAIAEALKARQEMQAIWDRRLPYEDEVEG